MKKAYDKLNLSDEKKLLKIVKLMFTQFKDMAFVEC